MDETKLQQMLEAQSNDVRMMLVAQTEEMQRHTGILFEHFDDKIKVVTEVVGMMNEKLTTIAEDVDELKTRMGGVEDRLDSVEQKVDRLERKVDTVVADVSDIKKQMTSKVDITTHMTLDHRVTVLEESNT